MTTEESEAVAARIHALEPALAPFNDEGDRVAAAIAELFDSFKSMRDQGENALARIKSTMETLSDFPAWAIEEACGSIRKRGYEVTDADGKQRLEQTWAPSEAQLHTAVDNVIARRRTALVQAKLLRDAEVEPPPEAKPGPSVEETLANFRTATGKDVQDDAEAVRRQATLKRMREDGLRDRTLEYAQAGLLPPVPINGVIASLPMMLKEGWTIQGGPGQRVLVAPTKEEADALR